MRVTRKKALVIAEAACRAYERGQHVPGGTTLLLPEDYATCSPSGFRYLVVNRPDGTFVRVLVDEPFAGIPYHYNPNASGTWLGVSPPSTAAPAPRREGAPPAEPSRRGR